MKHFAARHRAQPMPQGGMDHKELREVVLKEEYRMSVCLAQQQLGARKGYKEMFHEADTQSH